jgi:hypothetical protein
MYVTVQEIHMAVQISLQERLNCIYAGTNEVQVATELTFRIFSRGFIGVLLACTTKIKVLWNSAPCRLIAADFSKERSWSSGPFLHCLTDLYGLLCH